MNKNVVSFICLSSFTTRFGKWCKNNISNSLKYFQIIVIRRILIIILVLEYHFTNGNGARKTMGKLHEYHKSDTEILIGVTKYNETTSKLQNEIKNIKYSLNAEDIDDEFLGITY